MRFELVDPYSREAAQIWSGLDARSYFLSWGWMANWLACLPADRAPLLGVFRDGDRAVSAACFGRRSQLRRGLIKSRSLHLNTTGVVRLDELWIEYNGLVGADLPLAALVEALPESWDELVLPALDVDAFGGVREETHRGWHARVERRVPVYFVELETVRSSGLLPKLSGQTRSQIRRAQKLTGEVSVEIAADMVQAIEIYDELCTLHAATWNTRGQPGAFADPWFDRFHRRLIAERFRAGEIQMMRVRANGATLGCLYNLVWRGRVLQYQTGLTTSDDPRQKIGYVCHTAAIEHCASAGFDVYDFLGGDHRYKRSMSTASGWLVWCKVQRSKLRFTVEEHLTKLARKLRGRRQKPA